MKPVDTQASDGGQNLTGRGVRKRLPSQAVALEMTDRALRRSSDTVAITQYNKQGFAEGLGALWFTGSSQMKV
ncbi:hypothetical protein GCM10009813_28670 [Brevibacterium marinum]